MYTLLSSGFLDDLGGFMLWFFPLMKALYLKYFINGFLLFFAEIFVANIWGKLFVIGFFAGYPYFFLFLKQKTYPIIRRKLNKFIEFGVAFRDKNKVMYYLLFVFIVLAILIADHCARGPKLVWYHPIILILGAIGIFVWSLPFIFGLYIWRLAGSAYNADYEQGYRDGKKDNSSFF